MSKMKLILTLLTYTILILTVDYSTQRPVNNMNYRIRKTKRAVEKIVNEELISNTTNTEGQNFEISTEKYSLEDDPDWCNGNEYVLQSVSFLKDFNGELFNVTESVLMCNGSNNKLKDSEKGVTLENDDSIIVFMNVTEMIPVNQTLIEVETTLPLDKTPTMIVLKENADTISIWEVTNTIPLLWNVTEDESTVETEPTKVWIYKETLPTIPFVPHVPKPIVTTPKIVRITPKSIDIETEAPKPAETTSEQLDNATEADIVQNDEPEFANQWWYQEKDACSNPGVYIIVENTAAEKSEPVIINEEIEMYPYLVALQTDKFGLIGTGSIISSRVVLAAAHLLCCWNDSDIDTNLYVLAGTTNLEHYDYSYQKIYVANYMYHPNYDPQNYPNKPANDIVLLETITTFSFDDFVQPIFIPRPNEFGLELPSYIASSCEAISWKVDQNVVLKIFASRVYIQPRSECFKNFPVTAATHFCTTTKQLRCINEGPLVCDGRLVGVQSFVDAGCTKKKGNTYWTRVDRNMFWVHDEELISLFSNGWRENLNFFVFLACLFKITDFVNYILL